MIRRFRLDALRLEPFENRFADELRPIVGTQVTRCTADTDQRLQDLDHTMRADATGNVDRQTLAGELVDHGEALELLTVGAGVEHEVVGPDVIGYRRRQRPWA